MNKKLRTQTIDDINERLVAYNLVNTESFDVSDLSEDDLTLLILRMLNRIGNTQREAERDKTTTAETKLSAVMDALTALGGGGGMPLSMLTRRF